MNLLQYKSDEMFSSTQLIRKSKLVFDKLAKKEIEKAVILRDGKPSFLMMDFQEYEKLMEDYLKLKNQTPQKNITRDDSENLDKNIKTGTQEKIVQKEPTAKKESELNDDELLAALEKIDQIAPEEENDKQNLKEFWE